MSYEQIKVAVDAQIAAVENFKSGAEKRIETLEQEFIDLKSGNLMSRSMKARTSSLGDQVSKAFDENRDLFEKTRSVRLEIKAATDAVTTANGRSIATAGVGMIQGGILGLQNALPSRNQLATSAVEYSRFTGTQGAAAVQAAQGDTKAAIRPDHSLISQSAITIAGYAVMSRQALSDSAELKRAVEVTLARSVASALDAALVNGVAAPAFGGFETLATSYTSLVYTALVDAISEGVATMQTSGFVPDVVALNPADWLAIATAKGTANDHYLSGNYLGAMPMEMRGLRVVLSPSVDAGKGLVIDSTHSELLVADNFTVEIGYSGTQFVQNLATVLGEMRVIPVFRTTGSARLITPKAV
jgi:HK97 family phage major capsid protein